VTRLTEPVNFFAGDLSSKPFGEEDDRAA